MYKINIDGVSIILTKEQLEEIRKQTSENIFTATAYKEVCRRLKVKEDKNPFNKVKHLEQYFNQGWKPCWRNKNEYKYYPYYTLLDSGGLVFASSDAGRCGFFGSVGFFKTKEISDFVGRNFINIYEEIKG